MHWEMQGALLMLIECMAGCNPSYHPTNLQYVRGVILNYLPAIQKEEKPCCIIDILFSVINVSTNDQLSRRTCFFPENIISIHTGFPIKASLYKNKTHVVLGRAMPHRE